MPLRIAREPLSTEEKEVLARLFGVAKKCTRWGVHGEAKLGLNFSKIRGRTIYLRISARNLYLAVNAADQCLFFANMDLHEIEEDSLEIDLDDIEAIIRQLEAAVKKTSPVDL